MIKDQTIQKSSSTQDALIKEIQDLEKGFRELSDLTHKKYSEIINHESVISKLTVEKLRLIRNILPR